MAYCNTGNYSIQGCVSIGNDTFTNNTLRIRSNTQQTYNPSAFSGDYSQIFLQPATNCANEIMAIRGARPDGSTEGLFGFLNPSGPTSCIEFFVQTAGTGNSYSTKFLINNLGNVGIGTASPGYKLTISDTAATKLSLCGGTAQNGITFEKAGSGCSYYIFNGDYANLCGFGIYNVNTAALPFFINNSSYVGINTATPSDRLSVNGGQGQIQLRVDTSDGSTINVRPNSGRCGWISYTEDAVADRWGIGIKNGDAKLYFSSGNVASGGGTTRMVLDSNGKVGIGTTSGNGQLTVSVDQSSNNQHINIVGTQTSYSQEYSLGIPTSTKDFRIYDGTAGATRFTLTSAGNVGIGSTSPNAVLDIRGDNADNAVTIRNTNGSSYSAIGYYNCQGTLKAAVGIGNNSAAAPFANNAYVYTPASTDFLFYIAGGERMRVRCDGNIGIATTSPSYKLHVNGTFYAAGSSIKYKEGICNYNTDSCLFMCLKPVTYQYKDEFKHLGKELKSESQIGLIAEDVAEVMPELAVLINEEDEKVVRNVDYEKLSIVLLAEVQKLRKEVDDLKNK